MEKVMVFIDGSNFYHGLKNNIGKSNIDFLCFARKLCGDRKLIRIYYYNAPVKQEDNKKRYEAQQRFFARLNNVSYLTLKLGRLERRANVLVEKGVDINQAVDMLRMAYNDAFDIAILVSGDGDFATCIEAVKDLGKHVENAYFKKGQSFHLRQACDRFLFLDENFLSPCLL